MVRVLGQRTADRGGQHVRLGRYRATDGSDGARVGLDVERPHAAVVVGKRGSGKSHTLGVLAEGLARAEGVAPIVVDPMGALDGLVEPATGASVPARVIRTPTVRADTIPPDAWCDLLGLDHASPAGSLVWQAAAAADTLEEMTDAVEGSDADRSSIRAAKNHLVLADSWGVFDPGGLRPEDVDVDSATVVDCTQLPAAASNAVVRALARGCYDARIAGEMTRLPWLLLDEAHVYFEGVAEPALRTLLTRGRSPGVGFVAATQRPGALPEVALAQADLLIAHRLTARPDREMLARTRPSYLEGSLLDRVPASVGGAAVVDDATADVHAIRVRERHTPHGGGSPRASAVAENARTTGDRRSSSDWAT
ncbi:ATP-binding protein [Halovivax sp.]|uniref:ATP-binding protein n=1 Tax=Halovivax sp. TaxID=1935978 RepID=UPI0025BCFD2F|nr:ATP-binding protein [Halovivax sp.]